MLFHKNKRSALDWYRMLPPQKAIIPHSPQAVDEAELALVTLDEIEEWLVMLKKAVSTDTHLFNEWEIGFVEGVNRQYDARTLNGSTAPLTIKQLVRIRALVNRLANAVASAVVRWG